MIFNWNDDKNQQLKRERGISFERVVVAIEEGALLDVLQHPNQSQYPNQLILVVEIESYAICVPCVMQQDAYFLKTLFPSRKYTQLYLKEKHDE
ncbi:MAG: toxin [Methylophilus sp.]|nr:toxin [Methylophilus sp.]